MDDLSGPSTPEGAGTDDHRHRDGSGARRRAPARDRGLLGRLRPRGDDDARAAGDDQVWHTLDRLTARDPRWRLVGQVLVGPGGVFAFEVHDHPGASVWVETATLKVDGTSTSYLRTSRRAAAAAQDLLDAAVSFSVRVQPLVILSRCRHFTLKKAPPDVAVLQQGDLATFLRTRAPLLLPLEARAAAAALAHPA